MIAKTPTSRRAFSTIRNGSFNYNTFGLGAPGSPRFHQIMRSNRLSPLAPSKYTVEKLSTMDPDIIMNPFTTNLISISDHDPTNPTNPSEIDHSETLQE